MTNPRTGNEPGGEPRGYGPQGGEQPSGGYGPQTGGGPPPGGYGSQGGGQTGGGYGPQGGGQTGGGYGPQGGGQTGGGYGPQTGDQPGGYGPQGGQPQGGYGPQGGGQTGGGYGPQGGQPQGGYGPEGGGQTGGGYGPQGGGQPQGGYGPQGGEPPGGYGPGTGAPPGPCPPSMTCDTSAIDDLQCEASGVAAEAAELTKVADALKKRRESFDTARKSYTDARTGAAKAVSDIQSKLNDSTARIVCELKPGQKDCIDRSFAEVVRCLGECEPPSGCCVEEPCDFSVDTWSVNQIPELTAKVAAIEACFDDVLVKEPDALKARVETLKKLVDDLTTDLGADPRKDPVPLYTRALAAQRALTGAWGGFKDANDYQDCLCCGLTCSLQGRKALAELAGQKKKQECQEEKRKARCKWLADNIVEETLAVHLRLCPDQPCPGQSPPADATAVAPAAPA